MASANPYHQKPYVRLATPADFKAFVDVALRAFINDAVFNYFGSVTKTLDLDTDKRACKHRRSMLEFLTKACHLLGGRITILVEGRQDSKEEIILSGCLWLPPHRRLAAWKVPTIVRAGVIQVLKGWGVNGFMRIVFDYQETVEKKMEEVFKLENSKASTEDSWYLQLAFTDPEHKGKGFMSLLVQEHITHAPNKTIVLEATTPYSRDLYLHLGFVHPVSVKFGKGKSDARGVSAKGADAVGVECWAMAKWPSKPADA